MSPGTKADRQVRALYWQLSIALVGILGVTAGWVLLEQQRSLNHPLNIGDEPLLYVVKVGATLPEIASDLSQRGILEKHQGLVWFARWKGYAARIQAGEYEIPPGTTPAQLLNRFMAGKVVHRSLTLVEGWTFKQVLAAVRRHPHIASTLEGLIPETIMARLGLPEIHPEGRFFPDTYHFTSGATDVSVLKRAYETMEKRLAEEWTARAPDLPLQTPYEALILASIVEKETGQSDERARIAGVFVRRLKKRMRLASDPTVIYGLGDAYDGNIRRKDLRQDTPYNTYVRRGLPPTPIAMPGAESIRAVLQPELSDALFFVSKGDGSHYFSATLQEHERAVTRYQRRRKAGGQRPKPRER